MQIALTVLAVMIGILMTFMILLQDGKGAGLTALDGTKAAGLDGVRTPVRRWTAVLAAVMVALLIAINSIR